MITTVEYFFFFFNFDTQFDFLIFGKESSFSSQFSASY